MPTVALSVLAVTLTLAIPDVPPVRLTAILSPTQVPDSVIL
nr:MULTISPECIES: hypothetical protein [unclassified Anabaena]